MSLLIRDILCLCLGTSLECEDRAVRLFLIPPPPGPGPASLSEGGKVVLEKRGSDVPWRPGGEGVFLQQIEDGG
jgi:hypothetical protein